MDDELSFLEAIRAAPADDAARLVYADWLSERGDPRGEPMVAQCTVARLEATNELASPDYRRAVVAEALSVLAAEQRWLAWLGVGSDRSCQLFRGLPHAIFMNVTDVIDKWPSLARIPFSVLGVHGRPIDGALLRRIAALPGIGALDAVRLFDGEGGVYDLDAKKLAGVLIPDDTRIFGALAPAPPFDAICTRIQLAVEETDGMPTGKLPLSVRAFHIDSELHDVDQLLELFGAEQRPFDALTLLLKEDCSFEPLFEIWPFAGARSLKLHSVDRPTAPNGAEAFARSGIGRSLRELGGTIPLDDTLANALAGAPLVDLYLGAGGSLSALERVLDHPLRKLSVAGFPSRGVVELLAAKAPPTLAHLDLYDLADEDVPALASTRLSGVTRLSIWNKRSAPALLAMPELASIPWLLCGETQRKPTDTWPYYFRP